MKHLGASITAAVAVCLASGCALPQVPQLSAKQEKQLEEVKKRGCPALAKMLKLPKDAGCKKVAEEAKRRMKERAKKREQEIGASRAAQ